MAHHREHLDGRPGHAAHHGGHLMLHWISNASPDGRRRLGRPITEYELDDTAVLAQVRGECMSEGRLAGAGRTK